MLKIAATCLCRNEDEKKEEEEENAKKAHGGLVCGYANKYNWVQYVFSFY